MLKSVVYAECRGWPAMLSVYVLISDHYAECRVMLKNVVYADCSGWAC